MTELTIDHGTFYGEELRRFRSESRANLGADQWRGQITPRAPRALWHVMRIAPRPLYIAVMIALIPIFALTAVLRKTRLISISIGIVVALTALPAIYV